MNNYNFDPELLAYTSLLPNIIDLSSLDKIRHFRAELARSRPQTNGCEQVEITNIVIPGADGGPNIPARSYRPKGSNDEILPAIYEIHGGGFILGDLDMLDQWCINICLSVHALVISVDYRLAPEHPFPAAPNDCYHGFCWLFDSAEKLAINPEKIAISGQSAGACLAAATTLRARDEDGPRACFQLLEIPVVDNSLSTPSMQEFKDTPMWNRPNAEWGWTHYLGSEHEKTNNPYAVPAKAQELSGLPSTYISIMEFDPLRDEGIEFAVRLMQAGVSVELHTFPGTFHGSTTISTAKVTQRNNAEIIEVFKNHLHG